jgi:hypothetical protein
MPSHPTIEALLRSVLDGVSRRVESAPESDKLGIFRQFGWWFASMKLDERCSLDQLSSVLAATNA